MEGFGSSSKMKWTAEMFYNNKPLTKELQELFEEKKKPQNKAFLIRKLANLKYKDWSSMAEHLNVFQGLVNQLSTMKITFDDEVQALFLLSSLPSSWDTMVATLSNNAPNGKLTMNMVKENIFNEEIRRKGFGQSPSLSGFIFGSTTIRAQSNLQSMVPGSFEFNAGGGSSSSSSGGGNEANRKFVKVNRTKNRKK